MLLALLPAWPAFELTRFWGGYECVNPDISLLCPRLDKAWHVAFQLPDTHEIIFAWDPPPVGIPEPVLDRLRKDLRDEVVLIAIKEGNQKVDRTTQSSPTSGSQHSQSPGGLPEDLLQQNEEADRGFKW